MTALFGFQGTQKSRCFGRRKGIVPPGVFTSAKAPALDSLGELDYTISPIIYQAGNAGKARTIHGNIAAICGDLAPTPFATGFEPLFHSQNERGQRPVVGLVLRDASYAHSLRFAFRAAQNPVADNATLLPYLFAASSPFESIAKSKGSGWRDSIFAHRVSKSAHTAAFSPCDENSAAKIASLARFFNAASSPFESIAKSKGSGWTPCFLVGMEGLEPPTSSM